MMRSTRLKQLEQWVMEKEFVSMEEICERYGVHINTARADVKELIKMGIAVKRYGGVARLTTRVPTTFMQRGQTARPAKEEIGMKASGLLQEGDVVYIDSGTTTSSIFSKDCVLPQHLTVISNNLHIINWVMQNTDYACFVLPGKGDRQLNSINGLETIDSLRTYNIKKAFLGCRRIAEDGSLTSASSIDAKIKEVAIERSQLVYLMADAGKIGDPELYSFANITQIDCWICDTIGEKVVEMAKKYNITVR